MCLPFPCITRPLLHLFPVLSLPTCINLEQTFTEYVQVEHHLEQPHTEPQLIVLLMNHVGVPPDDSCDCPVPLPPTEMVPGTLQHHCGQRQQSTYVSHGAHPCSGSRPVSR